jgi:hypothetical protein
VNSVSLLIIMYISLFSHGTHARSGTTANEVVESHRGTLIGRCQSPRTGFLNTLVITDRIKQHYKNFNQVAVCPIIQVLMLVSLPGANRAVDRAQA